MIRQFRPGLWIDPDRVVCVTHTDTLAAVLVGGAGQQTTYMSFAASAKLADEIGEAARIAQETRRAADDRLHQQAFGTDVKSLADCFSRGDKDE